MKELNDIIHAYDKAVLQNKRTALVTVVKVDGSSYRRPGARMLVTEDGEITGAISGGCLEGDALRKAQFAIHQQQNKLEIYDTSDEADATLGVQLGCNGIVYILFEPVINDNPIALLKQVAAQRKDAVLVTLFNTDKKAQQKGTIAYVNRNKNQFINDDDKWLLNECEHVLKSKVSVIKDDKESSSVLFQLVPPVVQLVIAGAGNDAQPLMEAAFLLGWKIIVADGRPTHATQQRFAKSDQVIVSKPTSLLSQINVDEQTAFVLITHNYNYDMDLLEQLLSANCAYIGILGPHKKMQRMFDDLQAKGIKISKEQTDRIHAPVGLDIGAETAEEIGVSVVAEIKAVLSQRKGASLKERKSEIHQRV